MGVSEQLGVSRCLLVVFHIVFIFMACLSTPIVPCSNCVAVVAQWLILLWTFGTLLFLSGAFDKIPTVLVGTAPVLATVAFIVWTIHLVASEVQQAISVLTVGSGAASATNLGMIVQTPGGDSHIMAGQEFKSRYEKTHQQCDPALAQKGFITYQETTRVWAHQLTVGETSKCFPAARFNCSTGEPVDVSSGDYVVMSFPDSGEVSVINAAKFSNEYCIEATSETRVISQGDMLLQWDTTLRSEGGVYLKTTAVHAKLANDDGTIDTIVDGKIEANRSYHKGDYIVCGSRGGKWPMQAQQFEYRYDITRPAPAIDPVLGRAGFKSFQAKGKARRCPSPGSCYFPVSCIISCLCCVE